MHLHTMRLAPLAALATAACALADARSYKKGEDVPVQVNALQPMIDSLYVQNINTYDYYDERFGFCRPDAIATETASTVVLMGHRIHNSPIRIRMLENAECVPLCSTTLPAANAQFVAARIREKYALDWLVDDLSVSHNISHWTSGAARMGFPLGRTAEEPPHPVELHNHYEFHLEYRPTRDDTFEVVGASVMPKSLARESKTQCTAKSPLRLGATDVTISYTYSVIWTQSDNTWKSRWNGKWPIHPATLALTPMLYYLMLPCFIVLVWYAPVNKKNPDEEIELTDGETTATKSTIPLSMELFCVPRNPVLLSVLSGAGCQVLLLTIFTMLCGMSDSLSPPRRGALATTVACAWVIGSVVGGFVTVKTYKLVGGEKRAKLPLLRTMLPFSTFVLLSAIILNTLLVANGSAAVVPARVLIFPVFTSLLLGLGTFIIGVVLARRSNAWEVPNQISSIPSYSPRSSWYKNPWVHAIAGGFIPYGLTIPLMQLIMGSSLSNATYQGYWWQFLVFVPVVLGTTMAYACFSQNRLVLEEFRWHWLAFMTGGSAGLWYLAHGLIFWLTCTSLPTLMGNLIFLGYLVLICALIAVLFGFLSLAASFVHVRWECRRANLIK